MLFEDAEGGLYLWSELKEFDLPLRCHLFLLGMMWRGYNDDFMFLPEPFAHDTSTVVTITNKYICLVTDQLLHDLVVMLVGWSEHNRC